MARWVEREVNEKELRARLVMAQLGAEKGRADHISGLWAFLNGVACAVAILEETYPEAADRFASNLEDAGDRFRQRLTVDESAQYQKICDWFEESLQAFRRRS